MFQLAHNRHYLLENPLPSAAWKLECLQNFASSFGALEVVVDMCTFNLRNAEGMLHRKATRLLTSMQAVISMMLNHRCPKDHQHAPVIGGSRVTQAAGHYTAEFADALIQAFMNQYDFETRLFFESVDDLSQHEALVGERPGDGRPGDGDEVDSDGSFDLPEDEKLIISPAVKSAVYRLHVNTGHRSPLRLARALLICNAPREAIVAARRLKCDVCSERRPPKPRLPSSLPPPREVGQQIHLDLIVLDDSLKKSYFVAHSTDNVSRYQAAQVLPDKSTSAVIHFLQTLWIPLLGAPHTIIADQGKEFVSFEFSEWCESKTIFLYHCGVGAPWQNGVAERSGGTLKALVGAITQSQAVGTRSEMEEAVGEAVSAYNSDINEQGVAPLQAVTGRVPHSAGDVLNGMNNRLAEHSLISNRPSLARQVAMRETARLAMVRLHYSRGLRQAQIARSRVSTVPQMPQPGDIVFFWRAQKYNSRKQKLATGNQRKLLLNRWHGPGLLVALEGADGTSPSSNCFISFRGQLTKCPTEHVRKASSLESLAADEWEAAIDEVINAARHDAQRAIGGDGVDQPVPSSDSEELIPDLSRSGDGGGSQLTNAEIAAALQPKEAPSQVGSLPPSLPSSRLPSRQPSDMPNLQPVPETPVLAPITSTGGALVSRRVGLQQSLARARSLDLEDRGVKRPAEEQLVPEERPGPETSSALESQPAFEALTMSWEQLCNVAESDHSHPLLKLQVDVEMDRRSPLDHEEFDHGTWDGRWAFLCERDWNTLQALGSQIPGGESSEVYAVQAARKEYHWTQLSPERKKLWAEAAVTGWKAYIDNSAVQALSLKESADIRRDLARRKELDRILVPRFVLTDKHDGVRTASHPLPVKASARLVVPGYQDRANLEGQLRRDAPTGSRLAQHVLFCVAGFHTAWVIISADVKAAFLKGDPYVGRELYLTNTNGKTSPSTPLLPGQLARVLKGVFGLADAPREWWLRLSRAMEDHSWSRSLIDAAMWCLWSDDVDSNGVKALEGLVVAHVDDLLFTGSVKAERSLDKIGSELGFGSLDRNDFTWCGKRIRRASDGTIRISMCEYHENLQEVLVAKHRKSQPDAGLDAHEAKQLRAVLGSLQWLVAQIRFDLSFGVSTLQGESPPTVSTLIKANQLVREFKRTGSFELVFRAIDYRSGGIVVVSDAALGNVQRSGAATGTPTEKVYSQAGYMALLATDSLVQGQHGQFNILDARSHRIPRVCRSTYGAETLAAEEALDVGQLCRGFIASILGRDMLGRRAAEKAMMGVKLTAVVDAKDVHDKSNSDTPSYGSQKSLAFSISWMRSILRQPHTALRWTATSNMFLDALTKDMDVGHLRRIMTTGEWSISYSPEFVKQVTKARSIKPSAGTACADWPGVVLDGSDPMLPFLMTLGEKKGWHFQNQIGIQTAYNAKSYRTPEPRFSSSEMPLRSSFGRFQSAEGQCFWHKLESAVQYTSLPNQHALIGCVVPILVSMFHSQDIAMPITKSQQKIETDVEAST